MLVSVAHSISHTIQSRFHRIQYRSIHCQERDLQARPDTRALCIHQVGNIAGKIYIYHIWLSVLEREREDRKYRGQSRFFLFPLIWQVWAIMHFSVQINQRYRFNFLAIILACSIYLLSRWLHRPWPSCRRTRWQCTCRRCWYRSSAPTKSPWTRRWTHRTGFARHSASCLCPWRRTTCRSWQTLVRAHSSRGGGAGTCQVWSSGGPRRWSSPFRRPASPR